MRTALRFFINGEWENPSIDKAMDVISPIDETVYGTVALGNKDDVDRAVFAAKEAQKSYGRTTRKERIQLLETLLHEYNKREEDLVEIICAELGAPVAYARDSQVSNGRVHLASSLEALRTFEFETPIGSARVVKEPIGVSALITPWNFPLGLVMTKVSAALAAGCCCVLKPSELTPFSATAVAEIISAAGYPAGVFNLIFGLGPDVGEHLAGHPGVDLVSITGSTSAGIKVAQAAAATVKRVQQELGGKSANIILDDANIVPAVQKSVTSAFRNSGQSCSAPTRLLVPRKLLKEVEKIISEQVGGFKVGAPGEPGVTHGPVISARQYDSIQGFIASAIEEGAKVLTGGLGRADDREEGFFVRLTVLSDVTPDMRVAQEEIFGPVLVIIAYDTEEEAVQIANSTKYGLAAYIQSSNMERARKLARGLDAGTVHINFPPFSAEVPFGGWKQSGNGREYGKWGIEEYLEAKAITGYEMAESR